MLALCKGSGSPTHKVLSTLKQSSKVMVLSALQGQGLWQLSRDVKEGRGKHYKKGHCPCCLFCPHYSQMDGWMNNNKALKAKPPGSTGPCGKEVPWRSVKTCLVSKKHWTFFWEECHSLEIKEEEKWQWRFSSWVGPLPSGAGCQGLGEQTGFMSGH